MSVFMKEFSFEIAQANKVSLFMPLNAKSVVVRLGCF